MTAFAALPIYKTVSGYGNAAAPATVFFPSDPASQIRVVYVNYGSDSNAAVLNFSTGATAVDIAATNAATSSVTNLITSTNGLSVGAVIVLQHNGVDYPSTVVTWNSSTNYNPATTNGAATGGTNVVLAAGGWGVNTSIHDDVYVMSAATPIPIGAGTNVINGTAIYVGAYGYPVEAQLTPASVTNRVYSAGASYDHQ